MNQYTVLLVDDEEEVFQVIMKKLDWESMGFSIAGYARNGVEALEMAEELQPDVVMTDIKMPYMDGLTLCKKLKELYCSCHKRFRGVLTFICYLALHLHTVFLQPCTKRICGFQL